MAKRFGIRFGNFGQAESFWNITNAQLKQNQGTPVIIGGDDYNPVIIDKDYALFVQNLDSPPPGQWAIVSDEYIESVVMDLFNAGDYPPPIMADIQAKLDLNGLSEDISDWTTGEDDEGSGFILTGEQFSDQAQLESAGFGDPPGDYLVYRKITPPERFFAVDTPTGNLQQTIDDEWEIFIQP